MLCFSLSLSASGIIRVALPNMDREVKEMYQVVIQAKDMGGQLGGLAGTTTINITLRDVNDNPPRFSKSMFKNRCAGIIIERTEACSILSAFLYQQQFIPGVILMWIESGFIFALLFGNLKHESIIWNV